MQLSENLQSVTVGSIKNNLLSDTLFDIRIKVMVKQSCLVLDCLIGIKEEPNHLRGLLMVG